MFPGESVSFSCHINVSVGWEFLWYKDSKQVTKTSGDNHTISPVGTTNGGSYTCKAQRGKDQAFLSDSSQAINLKVEGKFMLRVSARLTYDPVICLVRCFNEQFNYNNC